MAYSAELATLITQQIDRFVTLNRYQLAGQLANFDFWIGEIRHALDVLDGYGVRFVKLETAQQSDVAQHGRSDFKSYHVPHSEKLHRVPDRELQKARRALTEAALRWLTRCRKEGLLPVNELVDAMNRLGINPHMADQ